MMKHVRLLAVVSTLFVAALFVGTSPACAEEHYTGTGLGMFQLDAGVGQKSSFGGYLQLGSDFMPYLGAEIRLGSAAGATKNNEKMQLDWLVGHFLKPYIELTNDFTLYGLAGFTINHTSLQIGTASKLKKTNISLSYGLGIQAGISNRLKLGAEWVSYSRAADATRRTTSFQGLNVNGIVGTLRYDF